MSASFPNAKKTFSQVVNGVTKLVAALFNLNYDETEAIETLIGAMGSTQANTDSYKNLLKNYKQACNVEYKSATEVYIRAGQLAVSDASGNMRFRVNTSDLTLTWTDIDTGAEENSTLYYVYVLADAAGTTFTGKISKSASAPSGATFYRKVGSFYNDGSGNIDPLQITSLTNITCLTDLTSLGKIAKAVPYTGNATDNRTVAHGLGRAPIAVLIAQTGAGYNIGPELWISGMATGYSVDLSNGSAGTGKIKSVDSTNITLGTSSQTNGSSTGYVALVL